MKLAVSDNDDPRCFIARARAAWLRGDTKSATEYATHARERALAANSKRAEEASTLDAEASDEMKRLVF